MNKQVPPYQYSKKPALLVVDGLFADGQISKRLEYSVLKNNFDLYFYTYETENATSILEESKKLSQKINELQKINTELVILGFSFAVVVLAYCDINPTTPLILLGPSIFIDYPKFTSIAVKSSNKPGYYEISNEDSTDYVSNAFSEELDGLTAYDYLPKLQNPLLVIFEKPNSEKEERNNEKFSTLVGSKRVQAIRTDLPHELNHSTAIIILPMILEWIKLNNISQQQCNSK